MLTNFKAFDKNDRYIFHVMTLFLRVVVMFALGATYGYSYPELLPMSCPWEGLRQES